MISRFADKSSTRPTTPYVTLIEESNLPFGQDPAYLGPAHRPFAFRGPDMENLVLSPEISQDRFADRATLLSHFDKLNRALDYRGEMAGMDAFTSRALEIVTSSKVRMRLTLAANPKL